MGEENTIQSPPQGFFRTFQSYKVENNSSLRHDQVESRPHGFSRYLIGYFQDILCKQANECEFLNCKMIGSLGQIANTQLRHIFPRKVKRCANKRKWLLKILSGVLLHVLQQQRRQHVKLSTRFALRKQDALSFTVDAIVLITVTFSPVVSATSYKLSQ